MRWAPSIVRWLARRTQRRIVRWSHRTTGVVLARRGCRTTRRASHDASVARRARHCTMRASCDAPDHRTTLAASCDVPDHRAKLASYDTLYHCTTIACHCPALMLWAAALPMAMFPCLLCVQHIGQSTCTTHVWAHRRQNRICCIMHITLLHDLL